VAVLFGGVLVATIGATLIKLALHWVGSQMVGWQLLIEFEIVIAAACLALGFLVGWLISPAKCAGWARIGLIALIGGMLAHILFVRSSSYAHWAATTALFAFETAGMIAFIGAAGRLLASMHMEGK
jgi:hypothetical protein